MINRAYGQQLKASEFLRGNCHPSKENVFKELNNPAVPPGRDRECARYCGSPLVCGPARHLSEIL